MSAWRDTRTRAYVVFTRTETDARAEVYGSAAEVVEHTSLTPEQVSKWTNDGHSHNARRVVIVELCEGVQPCQKMELI